MMPDSLVFSQAFRFFWHPRTANPLGVNGRDVRVSFASLAEGHALRPPSTRPVTVGDRGTWLGQPVTNGEAGFPGLSGNFPRGEGSVCGKT